MRNLCALAKITKIAKIRVAEKRVGKKLERVFADVTGPFRVESPSGFEFCIVLGNQHTKLCFVFMDGLKAKRRPEENIFSVETPEIVGDGIMFAH